MTSFVYAFKVMLDWAVLPSVKGLVLSDHKLRQKVMVEIVSFIFISLLALWSRVSNKYD